MKRILIGVVAVILLAGGGGYAWTRYAVDGGKRLDVQTASLQRGDVRRVISTSGTVKARVTVDVSVQVSGQISERPADYNSLVKKGDLLARVDPAPFETKIRQLDASIAIAQAGVAMAQAGLEKASINAAKAASDLDKNKTLAQTGAVTKAALETADNTEKLSKADLASANAQVQNANASLKQRTAEMESAQIDLEHTQIRAPIDGIVVDRTIEVGQTVATSSSAPKLFTLAQDLSSIDISAVADEADVAQIAVGNTVTFRVDAFPDVTFSGDVWQVRLAPVTQQNVVTYTVIIHANNPGNRLLPGMTANLQIVTGEHRGVLVVSNEALRFQPRGAAAALVQAAPPGASTPRPATQTPAAGSNADVVAGLQRDLGLDEATLGRIRVALRDVTTAPRAGQGGAQAPRAAAGQAGPGQAAAAPFRPGAGGPGGGAGGPPPAGRPGAAGAGDFAPTLAVAGAVAGDGGEGAAATRAAPNDVRDQIRARTDEVLRGILTAEQFAKYQALQVSGDTATRIGTLWVREADGTLSQHQVQLGLASLNQTEVVSSDLADGARIVLRVREVPK